MTVFTIHGTWPALTVTSDADLSDVRQFIRFDEVMAHFVWRLEPGDVIRWDPGPGRPEVDPSP